MYIRLSYKSILIYSKTNICLTYRVRALNKSRTFCPADGVAKGTINFRLSTFFSMRLSVILALSKFGPKSIRSKTISAFTHPPTHQIHKPTHVTGFGAQLIGPIQLHVKRQNSSICKFFQDIAWTFFCL